MAAVERPPAPLLPEQLPPSREERWDLLGAFVGAWFPPPQTAVAVDRAELDGAERRLALRLPPALREWYERLGARADVWSLQDRLLSPSEVQVVDGVLTFGIENQGVVRWGIRVGDLGTADPPVVVSDPAGTGSWVLESETTTAFALQFAVLNAKWSGAVRHHANGQGNEQAFETIERTYPRLPFLDAHWPPYPTRFYGYDDLIIEAQAHDWLWVTARSWTALEAVDALLRHAGMTWEESTIE